MAGFRLESIAFFVLLFSYNATSLLGELSFVANISIVSIWLRLVIFFNILISYNLSSVYRVRTKERHVDPVCIVSNIFCTVTIYLPTFELMQESLTWVPVSYASVKEWLYFETNAVKVEHFFFLNKVQSTWSS